MSRDARGAIGLTVTEQEKALFYTKLEGLFNIFGGQDFYNWYNTGRYYTYIAGACEGEKPVSKDDILDDLYKMMKRRNAL